MGLSAETGPGPGGGRAGLIDVNIGLPGIDKIRVMKRLIQELQLDIGVPLVIDSDDPAVLEAGLEVYVGKPVINSVNGEQGSMDQVFPWPGNTGQRLLALPWMNKGFLPLLKEDPDSQEDNR